ncbi:SdiA-regulated domain-containing protein [Aliigemmobacter aestuarii]|nr:SdiA-regulated domain-containing protein [Gemmobacter aestuarii]
MQDHRSARPDNAQAQNAFVACGICVILALVGLRSEPSFAQVTEFALGEVDTVRIAEPSRKFTEPSGITLASDGSHYWVVSDNSATVFLMTGKGKLKPSEALSVGVDDLEGITLDEDGNRLLAVQEGTSTVVQISLEDGSVSGFPIADMAGFPEVAETFGSLRTNNGLEGIAFDTSRREVLLVKEANPRLLLRLSSDLTTILGAVVLSEEDGFACDGTDDSALDVSDIHYDRHRRVLWVLSDTGACILIADPDTGLVIGRARGLSPEKPLRLPKNPEGISLDAEGTRLRIVTDDGKDSRMVILSIE